MVRTFSTFVLSSPRRIRVSVFGVCREGFRHSSSDLRSDGSTHRLRSDARLSIARVMMRRYSASELAAFIEGKSRSARQLTSSARQSGLRNRYSSG